MVSNFALYYFIWALFATHLQLDLALGTAQVAIASQKGVESRRSRIYGGRDWVRLGAVELGLDCLRRCLQGLPVTERTDFERV